VTTLLKVPQFGRLLAAWSIGNFADSALFLTLAVWAKDLTGSSGAAGLVFFCLGAPTLASPLFGLLADRVRRRLLLVASNLVAAGAVLGLLAVRAPSDIWILYLVTVCYGALGSLNSAAQSGLLRTMLSDEHLGPANALFMTIDQGLRIVTPLAGAGLYAVYGGPALAVVTAVLLVLTAGGLLTVRIREHRPIRTADEAGSDAGWRALSAGFRHLRGTPDLLSMVIGMAVSLSVIGLFDSILFAVVEHGLHREPAFFGVLMSAQGAGSILGGITSVWVLNRLGSLRAVALGLGLMAASSAAFLFGSTVAAMIGSVAGGAAIPWAFVALATTRQRLTPHHLQGRVASATGMSLQIPQLVSIAVGAAVVAIVDYRILIVGATLVIAGAALWLWRRRAAPTVPPTVESLRAPATPSCPVAAENP
jgi:MFS family permease